jgi:HAE1 family hydrophobic/amphiphilic exporter-1
MLENIVRHMEERGLSAWEASLVGSREIGFTIVSISLSLVAVFIPVLLMGGVIGRVFNEFAVVVAVAILASAFVSLTLTPMLCAKLLKPHDPSKDRQGFGIALERGFEALLNVYGRGLRWSLRRQPVILAIFLATCAATVWMGIVIPKGFFPQEDIGQLSVQTEARQDISFDAMVALQGRVMQVFQASPHVAHVASTVGVSGFSASGMNTGRMFVELKPQGERPEMAKVLADLRRELGQVAGISTYMTPVQNLNIGARASRSQYQYVLTSIDQAELYRWSERMTEALRQDRANFIDVATDLQNKGLQATLKVNRDRAQALGVNADQLRSTLYSGFGARQVSTIYAAADSYQVIVEFDPSFGWTSDRLDFVRVRSTTTGKLVPLSAFAAVERTVGPVTVNQLGQLPAVTLSFNLPPGVALGQAVDRVQAIRTELNMPPSIGATLAGTAKTFQQSLSNQGILILGAVLTIYIVLGILYESFIHPFTILTGLPSAAVGALATLQLFGLDLSVIAIIGMLMLIGIVKKNAIMMVDVAIELRRGGLAPQIAIYRACLMRFRPILMTTLAALLGALPIALGAGASAELRQPLGLVVVGGLVVSQVLTLFVTPVIYLTMERLAGLAKRKATSPSGPPIAMAQTALAASKAPDGTHQAA